MGLKIHALPAGVIRNFPVAAVQYQRGWGEFHDVPQIMFVITGGEHVVIVDSGTPDPAYVRKHHGYDFERGPGEEPLTTLRELGIGPDEVGTVVHTHLHWDHCGNNHLFPYARFVVQKAELHYAVDPLAPTRAAYENTDAISPPWASLVNRFRTVEGDAALLPDIDAVALPGHTPGSQGVVVGTGAGRVLLAGDTVDTNANWDGDERLDHIPSGSFVNLTDYMASFARIKALGARVVPSHDPEVLREREFG